GRAARAGMDLRTPAAPTPMVPLSRLQSALSHPAREGRQLRLPALLRLRLPFQAPQPVLPKPQPGQAGCRLTPPSPRARAGHCSGRDCSAASCYSPGPRAESEARQAMTDPISDDGRDDFILQERLAGRSARSISKELRCTVGEVNAALDRTLPQIDNAMRLRHISLDLHRLEGLLETFYKRAIEKVDVQAGLCVVKILERKAALLGLDQPTKLDIVTVQAQEEPSSFERLHEVIMRIARKGDQANDGGNGTDGAVSH